jgi:hypothetical protein
MQQGTLAHANIHDLINHLSNNGWVKDLIIDLLRS